MEGDGQPIDDPLRSMRAERVERDDGRYLVYFSWDAPQPDRDPRAEPAAQLSGAKPADQAASSDRDTPAAR